MSIHDETWDRCCYCKSVIKGWNRDYHESGSCKKINEYQFYTISIENINKRLNNSAMSAEIVRVDRNTVKLCCNKQGCPTVSDLGNGKVRITDDDGNFIEVKKEEAQLLSDGVKTLNNEQLLLG